MAYEGRDPYDPQILVCRIQDLLNWVEEASWGPLTEQEKIHIGKIAEEFRSVYGWRRYIPTVSESDDRT